jgi:hypothetical protein
MTLLRTAPRRLCVLLPWLVIPCLQACGGDAAPVMRSDATQPRDSNIQRGEGSSSQRIEPALPSAPAEPSAARTPPVPQAAAQTGRILDIASACARRMRRGRGIHGAELNYAAATIWSPAEARTEGYTDGLAARSDDYRSVHIPEVAPMNERVPNGLHVLLNVKTGHCELPRRR